MKSVRTTMDAHIYGLQIRVLLCHEEAEWVARALELDLLGYGRTQGEAIEALQEAIQAQLSFARQMNDDTLLPFPSEPEYFKRWEEAQNKAIRSQIMGDKGIKVKVRAVVDRK